MCSHPAKRLTIKLCRSEPGSLMQFIGLNRSYPPIHTWIRETIIASVRQVCEYLTNPDLVQPIRIFVPSTQNKCGGQSRTEVVPAILGRNFDMSAPSPSTPLPGPRFDDTPEVVSQKRGSGLTCHFYVDPSSSLTCSSPT